MIRIVLMFFAATNGYLYFKLRSCWGSGAWSVFYLLWALLVTALPFLSRGGAFGTGRLPEILFILSFSWIVIAGMACGVFLCVDALSLAARLVDFSTGSALYPRFFNPRKYVPAILCLVLVISSYSFFEAWNVRRVNLTLKTEKLPRGVARLRIVHVSDVHLGGLFSGARLERIMRMVRSAEADILAVTGDLVDGDMSGHEREAELIASHGAKGGAFAVTGNHEFYAAGVDQAVDFMERAGLTVLRDASASAAGIHIVGLDDTAKFGRGFYFDQQWVEGLTLSSDRFVLLLKHRPQVIDGTAGAFDLQLSGHTHGGQIWPMRYVVARVNGMAQHLSHVGGSAVYVSNGAGFWGPPLRFLAPPEITVIDLVREAIGYSSGGER